MRRYLALIGIAVLAASAWIVALPQAPVSQPFGFPHARHQAMACTVCHASAPVAARAGIPAAAICAKCHATAPAGQTQAWEALTAGSVRWTRVTRMPDHVLFSHRRHITQAELECASCHGNVGERITPVKAPAVRLEMDTCVSCHRQEGAAEDCAACHR